jgi:glucose-1-phosphate cytidylyltransferase
LAESVKVAILAGGEGTRISEETAAKPKPLIEIGTRPILWHIMQHYSSYGLDEFVIALGYRGEQIKRYFADYSLLNGSITVDFCSQHVRPIAPEAREINWTVHLVETGDRTGSGGRVARLRPFLCGETFMLTYCDGLSDIDLSNLIAFHRSHGKLATLTAVQPRSRYGQLVLSGDGVDTFLEKPQGGNNDWINGGFFVLEPGALDFIHEDEDDWARDVLPRIAEAGELMAFRHDSFWQCMDTMPEKDLLERLWQQGSAPWKTW